MAEQYDFEGRLIMEKIKHKILEIIEYLGPSGITKIVLILILLIFMVSVYSSSNAKDIDLDSLEAQLKKKTDINKMQKCSKRNLMQFMALDYNAYDSFIYYKSKEALGVDELLVIKANRKEDLSEVLDAVDKRVESQIKTFEGYGPKQVILLKDAIVYKKGQYLLYCVGKNPDIYQEVFKDAI